MDLISPVINFLIDLVVEIFEFLLGLLPSSPFQFEPLDWGAFGHAVGMFFPIGQMATHFTLILGAMLLYYGVRWLLRLIKMIQ